MKKVNTMRAFLLSRLSYEVEFSSMMLSMLNNTPSYNDDWNCNLCKNSDNIQFVFMKLDSSSFNDIADLNDAIKSKHRGETEKCDICKNLDVNFERKFNQHLFILLDQEEDLKEIKSCNIPEVIGIENEKFALFGAIIVIPPLLNDDDFDIRRFVSAVKLNQTWSLFDDMKTKPMFIASEKKFFIHCLLYTKILTSSTESAENLTRPTMTTANT